MFRPRTRRSPRERRANTFTSDAAVIKRTTDKCDPAIEFFDRAHVAKGGDCFAFVSDEPIRSVQSHAAF